MINLTELLQHQAQQLNAAERALLDKLPSIAQSATHARLQEAFNDYIQQQGVKVERLNMVASLLKVNPTEGKNKATKGLLKSAKKLAEMQLDFQVKDAALIAAAQQIIHCKIAAYGTVRHYANALELDEVGRVLAQSLEEEKTADRLFNDLAIEEVNPLAIKAGAAVL